MSTQHRGVWRPPHPASRDGDPRDEHDGRRDQEQLRGERPDHPDGEQERPDGWADDLVGQQVAALQPGVSQAQIRGSDEHRQQRRRRGVGEHLADAQGQHCDEDDADGHLAGGDRQAQQREDHGSSCVGGDDQAAAVDPVGHGAGVQAQQEPGQPLGDRGQRDQHGAAGQGCDQQGTGGQHDPVAEVADPARGQQPPEAATHPGRRHQLRNPAHSRTSLSARGRAWSAAPINLTVGLVVEPDRDESGGLAQQVLAGHGGPGSLGRG